MTRDWRQTQVALMEHQSTLIVNYRSTPCSRFLFSAPPLDTAETTDAEVKATRGGTKWL